MRFSFGCGPSGFHVDAGATFDKRAVFRAMALTEDHRVVCPYCRFKLIPPRGDVQ